MQSFVISKLSQKLRHIRWMRKIRSEQHITEQPQRKKKKCSVNVLPTVDGNLSYVVLC